ncbi:hypothetical protein HYY75_06780, partial [bacterium]|nr:hypothetical protein [bacterium]
SPDMILNSFIAKARQRHITYSPATPGSLSKIEVSPPKIVTQATSNPQLNQQPKISDELGRFGRISSFNSNELNEFLKLVSPLKEPDDVLGAIEIIAKAHLKEPKILTWLGKQLSHPADKVKVTTMDLLSNISPRFVLPHLPILCFHPSPEVASQATRNLRKLEGASFVKRLQTWIKDQTPASRETVLKGLMQMEFGLARSFVLDQIKRSRDLELIEKIGVVLLLNPDRKNVLDLEKLILDAPSEKKKVISLLVDRCKQTLSEIGVNPESSLAISIGEGFLIDLNVGGKIDHILEAVKGIHYKVRQEFPESVFSNPVFQVKAVAILIGVIGILLGLRGIFPSGNLGQSAPKTYNSTSVIAKPSSFPIPEANSSFIGVIDSYDPLNHSWKVLTSEGKVFKIDSQKPTAKFSKGDRIEVTVATAGVSPAGYVKISPKNFIKLK